jgi:predicted ribosome quality control (RQC) complex YloA/Tae2 family protein
VPAGASRFVPACAPEVTIELDPELDAKANAAAIFNRYRKATTKLEHTARRLAELGASERFADELAWELERAEPETLDDVADSIERLERRKAVVRRERARRQKPLDVRVSDDARIYVGRSPRGNADLTFRIARPGDLWFHVRATPGAHVVLQFDSERSATADELERAAGLAAYHSKARNSDKVSVDYTERKYVRRQQNAPPGLVWYTHARTLLVAPAGERS